MDYVHIKGFKSIKDQQIELRPINILIGSNGSGKTNFLSFFEFLREFVNRDLQNYIGSKGGAEKILFNGSKNTYELSFDISFRRGTNGYEVSLQLTDNGLYVSKEHLSYGKSKENAGYVGIISAESNLRQNGMYRSKFLIEDIESLRKYHFHDTGRTSPFFRMSNINTNIHYLEYDGGNLAAMLYMLQNSDTYRYVYNRILYAIQSIAPYFLDFYLQPNSEGYLNLLWKSRHSDTLYNANNLSDGTIRFIALAVLFLQHNLQDKTIVIDEPELGLHPAAINMLSDMIKSAADNGASIITATQSTELIGCFVPEDIITVSQTDEGESVFNRLSSEGLANWLEYYTIDDLWKRGIIPTGQVYSNLTITR